MRLEISIKNSTFIHIECDTLGCLNFYQKISSFTESFMYKINEASLYSNPKCGFRSRTKNEQTKHSCFNIHLKIHDILYVAIQFRIGICSLVLLTLALVLQLHWLSNRVCCRSKLSKIEICITLQSTTT